MTPVKTDSNRATKRTILVIVILVTLAFALLMALVISSTSAPRDDSIDADAYADELAVALNGADAGIGAELVETLDCAACHLLGDGSLAPLFAGIADFAGQRRPPLSAEQYLYEAILYPAVHLVDGYNNVMPNNYDERLSQGEVGNIIAYLLTLTAAS